MEDMRGAGIAKAFFRDMISCRGTASTETAHAFLMAMVETLNSEQNRKKGSLDTCQGMSWQWLALKLSEEYCELMAAIFGIMTKDDQFDSLLKVRLEAPDVGNVAALAHQKALEMLRELKGAG